MDEKAHRLDCGRRQDADEVSDASAGGAPTSSRGHQVHHMVR